MKKAIYIGLGTATMLLLLYLILIKDFEKEAPTIYTNGNIITLNDDQPAAEAMFIKDGVIVEIGSNEAMSKYSSEVINNIDLKSATIMPGFIDSHTHFALTMFMSDMIDLSGFKHKSNSEVWEYFEFKVAPFEKGEWIVCKGIDPILVGDLIPPTLNYLDKVAPDNPVIIFSQSLHSYWVNSKAYELAGITVDTPNPSKHSYYAKNKDGQFSGLIVEQEAIKPFTNLLKEAVFTSKKLSMLAPKVMSDYAKRGNTTIVSAGITITDEKPFLLFDQLSNGRPTLLGNILGKLGIIPERKANPRHFMYLRHEMAHLMPEDNQSRNDFYDIIGIKHWYDGSPYIGTMYLSEPYLPSELTNKKLNIPVGHKGEALIDKSAVKAFIKTFHNKGWQIAIHAQGDAANSEVLDVYEALASELDYSSSRHRLEHCLLLSLSDLERMKKLNITPSYHVNHLYYYGDALKANLLGAERTENMMPIGSTLNKGIKFSLHADQPMFESHPFRLIQTAVERKTVTGGAINEQEKIGLTEAIKSMTINAAWQINMEDKIGSLEKGKYADFIIVDKNPYEIPIQDLENIKCLKTYVHGNLVND